jgi:hypothetical protein
VRGDLSAPQTLESSRTGGCGGRDVLEHRLARHLYTNELVDGAGCARHNHVLGFFGLLRLVLKRQAGGIGTTDILVIVLLAEVAGNGFAAEDKSVVEGTVLVGTILFWSYMQRLLARDQVSACVGCANSARG